MNKTPWLALMMTLATAFTAAAQAQPTPPAPTASAPAGKPGPRLLTPEEKRDNASPADQARPEGTVTPQIKIPLGDQPVAPAKPDRSRDSSSRRSPPAAIDDAVARCSALVEAAERERCLERQSRERSRQ